MNRLHNVTMASHYSQTFNYDQYGNMVCAAGSNYCNTTITFDQTTNRITSNCLGGGYCYDAAGNLLRDGTGTGTHTFDWDAESRMKSVDGGATGTFAYNALGQRVQKTFGGSSVYYYYDGFGNLAMTQNGSAQQLEQYIPGAGAKYVWTGTAWETHYLHGNNLGSTQLVMRANNSYEEARNFYAFGGLRWQGGGAQDMRFASMQKRDSETTGWQDPLDWTPNRLYSQGFGRWFSPDPLSGDITNPQSLNRYGYGHNNPGNLADPTGLCGETVTITDNGETLGPFYGEPCPPPPQPPSYAGFGSLCAIAGFFCPYDGGSNYAYSGNSGGGSGGGTSNNIQKGIQKARALLSDPDCAGFLKGILKNFGVAQDLDLFLRDFDRLNISLAAPDDPNNTAWATAHVDVVGYNYDVHVEAPGSADLPATLLHENFHTISFSKTDVQLARAVNAVENRRNEVPACPHDAKDPGRFYSNFATRGFDKHCK